MSGRDWIEEMDDPDNVRAQHHAKEHRVHGPPGTGKTTYLSRQVERAASLYGDDAVSVASLTRAAAAEVKGRRTSIPDHNIGTLHSHAFRAIARRGSPPALADTADGFKEWNDWVTPIVPAYRVSDRFAVDPENAPERTGGATEGEDKLAELTRLRACMVDLNLVPGSIRDFNTMWTKFKEESGRIDFTDLIEQAYYTIPTAPGNPAVFMLDEAQDLSRLEMALARKWGGRCEQFVVVGDQDQNLYEWRGSEPEVFTSVTAASSITLEQSYRVPKLVHAYAVNWIERIKDREPISYLPTDLDGEVRAEPISWGAPLDLMPLIVRDLDEGLNVMVLASCAFMLDPLVENLKLHGVPFHNPYRVGAFKWNPLAQVSRPLAFLRPDNETFGKDARWWTWDDLRTWTDPLDAAATMHRGNKAFILNKCREDQFGESRANESPGAGETIAMFLDEHCNAVMEQDLAWWEAHLRGNRASSYRYPLEVARQHGRKALRKPPKVVVGTIHSVKGGEADSVYVFPDLSRLGYLNGWGQPGRTRHAVIRQFYVALTRARKRLTVLAPDGQYYAPLPMP